MMRAALATLIETLASIALGLGLVFGVGLLLTGTFLEWTWSFFLAPFVWGTMAAWVVVLTIVAARRGRRAGITQLSLSALAAGAAACIALSIQQLVVAAQFPDSPTSGMGWLLVIIAAGYFLAFYLATFPVGAVARAILGPIPAPVKRTVADVPAA